MDASDALIAALTGRTVTTERIESAATVRVRLAVLRTELGHAAAMLPPDGGEWRSAAADRYAERLHALRSRVLAAVERLDAAAADLEERIRRMQAELAAFEEAERDAEVQARAAREAALAEEARLARRAEERHAEHAERAGAVGAAGGRS
ncbi:hypothetical protein [Agromyces italicus]|uniref:hypothetical protein n=1 Tax=Agromyces italicus TaxID=279572 RepID=UPI0012FAC403|nr:hypothetical protein [Agromyces italicus]